MTAGLTGSQAIWKLQYTERGKSSIIEIQPKNLARFVKAPWFTVSDDGTGATLTAPVDGATTSGSSYTRCEGRECTKDGELAEWDSRKGAHRLVLWMRLDDLMVGGKVSLLQLHDELDDQIQILAERTKGGCRLFWSVGKGKGKGGDEATIDPDFTAGVWVPCLLEVMAGRTSFYIGSDWSTPKVSTTKMRQSAKTYAKWGVYCQVKTPKGANISASFRGVTMTHDATVTPTPTAPGQPTPPVPVPQPAPNLGQQRVLIIRHGEKPTPGFIGVTRNGAKDSHSLTPDGWARAGALVGYFLGSGLTCPTSIFASQGKTDSRRPAQTVTPLAEMLGLPIETRWDAETPSDFVKLVAAVKAAPGVVMVCLEHSMIPKFVKALGGALPSAEWPDRWDLTAVLTPAGTGYSVALSAQRLLKGDRPETV